MKKIRGPYYFLSYAKLERHHVEDLARRLKARGIEYWWDDFIEKDYESEVPEAIRDSKAVIVLVTLNSMGSAEILKEIKRALSYRKNVVPVWIGRTADIRAADRRVPSPIIFATDSLQRYEVNRDELGDSDVEKILKLMVEAPEEPDALVHDMSELPVDDKLVASLREKAKSAGFTVRGACLQRLAEIHVEKAVGRVLQREQHALELLTDMKQVPGAWLAEDQEGIEPCLRGRIAYARHRMSRTWRGAVSGLAAEWRQGVPELAEVHAVVLAELHRLCNEVLGDFLSALQNPEDKERTRRALAQMRSLVEPLPECLLDKSSWAKLFDAQFFAGATAMIDATRDCVPTPVEAEDRWASSWPPPDDEQEELGLLREALANRAAMDVFDKVFDLLERAGLANAKRIRLFVKPLFDQCQHNRDAIRKIELAAQAWLTLAQPGQQLGQAVTAAVTVASVFTKGQPLAEALAVFQKVATALETVNPAQDPDGARRASAACRDSARRALAQVRELVEPYRSARPLKVAINAALARAIALETELAVAEALAHMSNGRLDEARRVLEIRSDDKDGAGEAVAADAGMLADSDEESRIEAATSQRREEVLQALSTLQKLSEAVEATEQLAPLVDPVSGLPSPHEVIVEAKARLDRLDDDVKQAARSFEKLGRDLSSTLRPARDAVSPERRRHLDQILGYAAVVDEAKLHVDAKHWPQAVERVVDFLDTDEPPEIVEAAMALTRALGVGRDLQENKTGGQRGYEIALRRSDLSHPWLGGFADDRARLDGQAGAELRRVLQAAEVLCSAARPRVGGEREFARWLRTPVVPEQDSLATLAETAAKVRQALERGGAGNLKTLLSSIQRACGSANRVALEAAAGNVDAVLKARDGSAAWLHNMSVAALVALGEAPGDPTPLVEWVLGVAAMFAVCESYRSQVRAALGGNGPSDAGVSGPVLARSVDQALSAAKIPWGDPGDMSSWAFRWDVERQAVSALEQTQVRFGGWPLGPLLLARVGESTAAEQVVGDPRLRRSFGVAAPVDVWLRRLEPLAALHFLGDSGDTWVRAVLRFPTAIEDKDRLEAKADVLLAIIRMRTGPDASRCPDLVPLVQRFADLARTGTQLVAAGNDPAHTFAALKKLCTDIAERETYGAKPWLKADSKVEEIAKLDDILRWFDAILAEIPQELTQGRRSVEPHRAQIIFLLVTLIMAEWRKAGRPAGSPEMRRMLDDTDDVMRTEYQRPDFRLQWLMVRWERATSDDGSPELQVAVVNDVDRYYDWVSKQHPIWVGEYRELLKNMKGSAGRELFLRMGARDK